jgi:hypothetical protein
MPEARRRKRHAAATRPRTAVRVIVTAVVLGLLILVVGVVVNIVRSGPAVSVPGASSSVTPGQADYEAGLSALASGDTTKAADLLSAAAAAGNAAAKAKFAEMSKGSTSGAGAVPSDAYTKAVANLGTFLPTSVSGYDMANVETSSASAIVSAEPAVGGPEGKVRLVVFTVLDKSTTSGASDWMARFPRAYPEDVSPVTVGTVTGRFGTDGSHLAAVAFVKGRYAFEVVTTVVRGDPLDLKSLTLEAAAAFAATQIAP